MAVVAVAGDDAVAGLQRVLDADGHRLLADVEVAEAADQAHAVELAGLLLEAADQQHLAVVAEQILGGWGPALARRLRAAFGGRPGCHQRLAPPFAHDARRMAAIAGRAVPAVYTVSGRRPDAANRHERQR